MIPAEQKMYRLEKEIMSCRLCFWSTVILPSKMFLDQYFTTFQSVNLAITVFLPPALNLTLPKTFSLNLREIIKNKLNDQ